MTQDGCDPLLGVSFSPSGQLLALISRSAVHLYQVIELASQIICSYIYVSSYHGYTDMLFFCIRSYM